jgi:hypothetical protein
LVVLEEVARDSKELVKLGEADSWISHQERIRIKNSRRTLQKESMGEVETVSAMIRARSAARRLKQPTSLVAYLITIDSKSTKNHDQTSPMISTVDRTPGSSRVGEHLMDLGKRMERCWWNLHQASSGRRNDRGNATAQAVKWMVVKCQPRGTMADW